MLEIRPSQPSDLQKLRLRDEVLCGEDVILRVGRSGFSLAYTPALRAEWRAFPPRPDALAALGAQGEGRTLLTAVQDGAPAGAALALTRADGWTELMDIRVDIACRRDGVASAMLLAVEQFSRRQGMAGICARVPDSNPVMCQFLEHHRFTVQGMDRMALSQGESERGKPMQQRACLLFFYRLSERG